MINNFILVKYIKKYWDSPKHVQQPNLEEWNNHHQMMFRTILEQLNFFYPKATIHVLTNEKEKNFGNIIWHYRPELEENHSTKLELYGLLNVPAMYIDSDIIIVRSFHKKHLITKHSFNLFQVSYKNLENLTSQVSPYELKKQYNCGMIWIPRPNQAIVKELKEIKLNYFNDKKCIEENQAWFNNDEHPTSYFVNKYNMKMNLFKEINVFRNHIEHNNIFNMQSIHYTGIKNKKRFIKEYQELCKARTRIF